MQTPIEQLRERVANGGMNSQTWESLPRHVREQVRDNSKLEPLLVGLEGYRIECTQYGERVRFQVGKSTGWRPCHLALYNARSMGGESVTAGSVSDVRIIRKVR